MSDSPAISVIVPVYNVERFLEQCLESIVNQTFNDIEIICINDGSTDNSLSILEKYQKKDKRIRIISQYNKGLSEARNIGIKNAKGKYISFIDSDDFIDLEMFDILFKKSESTQSDITICNFKLFFEDTKTYGYYRDEIFYYHLKSKIFNLRSQPQIINCIAAWDRLIRKDFLDKYNIKFISGMIYEDVTFHIECMIHASKIALIPDHLYFYRKNAGGSITDNEERNKKSRLDFITIRKYALNILQNYNASQEIWYFYTIQFLEQALMHFKNCKDTSESLSFFKNLRLCINEQMYNIHDNIKYVPYKNFMLSLKNNDINEAYKVLS